MEKRSLTLAVALILAAAFLSSFTPAPPTGMVSGFQRREAFGPADIPILPGEKVPKTFPSFSLTDQNLISHLCNGGVLNEYIIYDVTTIRWLYYTLWWKYLSRTEQQQVLHLIGIPSSLSSSYTSIKAFETWFRYMWTTDYATLANRVTALPGFITLCNSPPSLPLPQ